MRTFNPFFEALVSGDLPDVFYSVEVPHATGILYLADRNEYVEGLLFQNLLIDASDVQFLVQPADKKMDVPSITVTVDNFPRISPDNKKFSSYIDRNFQARFVPVYWNALSRTGQAFSGTKSVHRELAFYGVPRRDISAGIDTAVFTLKTVAEHYLSRTFCRIVKSNVYTTARAADIGRAIPYAFAGSFAGVRAIQRRSRQATVPVPDPGNTGDARLGRPTIFPLTVTETWTITANDPQLTSHLDVEENDYQILAADPDPSYGSGVRRAVWRSFTPSVTDEITGVKLRLERLASDTAAFSVYVVVYTDNGGAAPFSNRPNTYLAWGGISPNAIPNNAEDIVVPITKGSRTLTAGTKYWIGVRTIGAGVAGGRFNLHFETPSTYNEEINGSGARVASYSSAYDFPPASGDTTVYASWTAIVGTPIFEIQWRNGSEASYRVTGTVSGDQGLGHYDEDYTAPNGRLAIPTSIWGGTPDGGDFWTFTTSNLPAQLVFVESEAAAPVTALSNVRLEDETPVTLTATTLSFFDGEGLVAMTQTMDEIREDVEVYGDVSMGALSANPSDVMLAILRRLFLGIDFYIDLASFATAKTQLAALSWTFAGMVNDAGRDYRSVLLDMAFQSRCRFAWPLDKARLSFLYDSKPTDLTIQKSQIKLDSNKNPIIRRRQLDVDEFGVVNVVRVRYARDWSEARGSGGYTKIDASERDPISIGLYGERAADENFQCDFITADAVANQLAKFLLKQKAFPPWEVTAELTLDLMKLEPQDTVEFDLDL